MATDGRFAIAAGMTLLLAAAPALAQQGQGIGGGRGGMMGGGMMMEQFQIIDEDGDGAISLAEWEGWHGSVFTTMDADEDGALSMEEFMAVRMGPGAGLDPKRQQMMQAHKEERFRRFDVDGDARLTRDEFMTGVRGEFKAIDTGGDGTLSPEEFRAHRRGL